MSFEWIFWTSGNAFTARLRCAPIVPGTLYIKAHDGTNDKDVYDDGVGNLIGDGSGTVDYGYGVVNCDFTLPLPVSGTEMLASYDPLEGGCYDVCGACPTNKIRLDLSPAAISGQGEMAISVAWNRLMTKIRRDVLPIHVEILTELFEEYYILHVGHRFDLIAADTEELDMHGIHLVFDSTEW